MDAEPHLFDKQIHNDLNLNKLNYIPPTLIVLNIEQIKGGVSSMSESNTGAIS